MSTIKKFRQKLFTIEWKRKMSHNRSSTQQIHPKDCQKGNNVVVIKQENAGTARAKENPNMFNAKSSSKSNKSQGFMSKRGKSVKRRRIDAENSLKCGIDTLPQRSINRSCNASKIDIQGQMELLKKPEMPYKSQLLLMKGIK